MLYIVQAELKIDWPDISFLVMPDVLSSLDYQFVGLARAMLRYRAGNSATLLDGNSHLTIEIYIP